MTARWPQAIREVAAVARCMAGVIHVTELMTGVGRLQQHWLAGETLAEIADKLGIAITTVRTHLAHIFDKTGTSRQADLIRLSAKFSSPVGHPEAL
jgi:DNA-binding CsgD family transcriptional regulator